MTGLGIIRLACACAAWVASLIDLQAGLGATPDASSGWYALLDNPPLLALAMVWPVVLGILVSRVQRPEAVRLASATFFLIAIAGIIKFAADLSLGSGVPVAIGSFRLNRSDLAFSTPKGIALTFLGMFQLLAELAVACRATWILRQPHGLADSGHGTRAAFVEEMSPRTRSILIRCGWALSLIFLVLVVRLPMFPKLNDLVSSSPLLRELLLIGDRPGDSRRGRPQQRTQESLAQEREVQSLIFSATSAWADKKYDEARDAYEKAIAICRDPEMLRDQQSRNNLALLQNNLAWLLVTQPDSKPDDPPKAVSHAQEALASSPTDGNYWNTLAAAQYRAKNWQSAREALLRSMELRGDGDGYDWILYSLVYARMGRQDRARDWFDKAARWRRDFRPWDQELYQFETEAAGLLELPAPTPPTKPRMIRHYDDHGDRSYRGRGLPTNPPPGEPRRVRRADR